ncbi:MAG: pyridoxamine 5'-phosphate oxidase family protein [Acidimicrobiia bacterium]
MLDDKTIELARGKNFGVMSTLMASGHPQSHMMWVDTDGEHIIINTEIHRTKFRNLERNPLVTVLICETGNAWNYSEIRGHVAEIVRGQEARDHIDAMAKKYFGVDDYPNPIQSERLIVKIAPDRVITFPPPGMGS